MNNRYISNSILKYGHNNFNLVIIEIVTVDNNNILKNIILKKEQYYIDILKPQLNLSSTAGSNYDYKHSKETKQM
jgi:group I intron endonuclease